MLGGSSDTHGEAVEVAPAHVARVHVESARRARQLCSGLGEVESIFVERPPEHQAGVALPALAMPLTPPLAASLAARAVC
eukprot:scaffold98358_cov57-Phaeocystis_antarctica.AAC.4